MPPDPRTACYGWNCLSRRRTKTDSTSVPQKTPHHAFNERDHAKPETITTSTYFRVCSDKEDNSGKVTVRQRTLRCHIHAGPQNKGTKIRLYIADCEIRIIAHIAELLRHLTLDPAKRCEGLNRETK